ncbi:MAG: UvrD-helicase domain-containing protein [Bacteroidales bacterium]|nr:UvrD-helicase domain-containing protein [Bacteroidales bacterium]MCD8395153.1 UvrD-helicase domain-containing protein [Bacteroidales bacterium]
MAEEYLNELNDQQRDAVVYTDGPALVIAGAGSGKTRVLTYKIVHLLAHGYEPWRILALTFTNKAAREMRERIQALVGPATASKLWMGTFHSIFARILRQHADRLGFRRDYTIYDTADSKALVKTIIKDMQLDDKLYKPSTVLGSISAAKNALISPEMYAQDRALMEADKRSKRPFTQQIYAAYRQRCFVAGAMDFDDLLYFTNVLLRDNPDILHHYQEYFRFILVDEYQDTNFAQHLIVSQLAAANQSLCVVGDDAQSIYSFRGANIRNILNLRNSYPSLKIFKLEQNYRSTQTIINAANSLIEKNTEQIPKKVFSKKDVGARIEVVQSYSDYEESFLVANKIAQQKMRSKDSYEEFAILYRTNAQSRILEESLRKRNIPYRIYGSLSFYQRKEVKDAIAYFRLSINPHDDEALRRIINNPGRGIGETTVNKLVRCAIDGRVSIWTVLSNPQAYGLQVNSGTQKKLDSFFALIQSFVEMNEAGTDAEEVATDIIRKTGLLTVLLTDRTPESISKQENLNELVNGVGQFVSSRREEGNEEVSMRDFLAQASLATDQDEDTGEQERVTLMTVHAAKGLEFSNVFIVGVEEELFPSAMACNSLAEIEEERRLLYVALTRAKNYCMMSYASSRYRNGATNTCSPSRFLRDINPDYLQLATGTTLGGPRVDPVQQYRSSFHSPGGFSGGYGGGNRNGARSQYGSNRGDVTRSASTDYMSNFPSVPPGFKPLTPSSTRPTPNPAAASSSQGCTTHNVNELQIGMPIEHPRFGQGEILSIDDHAADVKITVKFSNVETKTLLLKFAKFKILS